MLRRTPLERGKPLRRVRVRRQQRSPEAQAFMDWGHKQGCIVSRFSSTHVCSGRIECCHRDEGKGVGMKTDDLHSIFVCTGAARDWDNNRGVFEGTRALRRMAHRALSAATLERYWKDVADGKDGCPF